MCSAKEVGVNVKEVTYRRTEKVLYKAMIASALVCDSGTWSGKSVSQNM